MRYFVEFSYLGTSYHGWQAQPNAVTVQEVMEAVFSTVLRQKIELLAAGRTDTGVHARYMVAHFDTVQMENVLEVVARINNFLPEDIGIHQIYEVHPEAHARFHATERTYEYWIVQHKDPFYKDAAWHVRRVLNIDGMNEAASVLMEFNDFECFSKSNTDVKTFQCTIRSAGWTKENNLLVFQITADRFLRNMVRAIVGTLLEVGLGKIHVQDVKTIIKSRDRAQAGVSVPAKGLYLTRIVYPDKWLNK